MSVDFMSMIPVNKQAAISVSYCNSVLQKDNGGWRERKEWIAKVPSMGDRRRIAKAMFTWAARQDWCCNKVKVIEAISEHFNVRFTLCRVIVNERETRGLIKCRWNRVEFVRQIKRGRHSFSRLISK